MNELDGIKDFIEANKESLENMNKEMIARYGQVPLVWLTVDEAKYALKVVRFSIITCEAVNEHKDKLWNFASLLHRRIEQAEGKR